MRRYALSAVLAVVLLSGGATAAAAADSGNYGPNTPPSPSLSGSMVSPVCDANTPWIDYSVVLDDPNGTIPNPTARLVLSDGDQSTTIPLGALVDGQLSGRVLWPGASVDANGVGNGWPGWAFENGQWVAAPDNFGWTRGDISAAVEVNPTLRVALSYPPSTTSCLTDPPGASTAAIAAVGGSLPETGGNSAAVLPIAAGAGALVLAGGVLMYVRRTRRVRD